LRHLQTDLAKYEQIKSKNSQMLKNALESEKQLEQLRKEIIDMKKLKVKLMNQLREESSKNKLEEQKRQREIAVLKRDHLKKDNQIKSLEAEKKCREIVLKRKQEQIQALRKSNVTRNNLSDKASGRALGDHDPIPNHTSQHNSSQHNNNNNNNNNKPIRPPPPASSSKIGANFESSYMSKRKLAFQHKWQKFDETVSVTILVRVVDIYII
jgi:hypothetical protein